MLSSCFSLDLLRGLRLVEGVSTETGRNKTQEKQDDNIFLLK